MLGRNQDVDQLGTGQTTGWLGHPGKLVGFALLVGLTASLHADETIQFNRDIRPILADKCFYCHGQDANKRQAELRLDDRQAALAAGAFVPGDVAGSKLLERIHSTDPDTQMPPPDSNRSLSPAEKQ